MGKNVKGLKDALKNITGRAVDGKSKGEVLSNFNKLYLDVTISKIGADKFQPGDAKDNQAAVSVRQNGVNVEIVGKLADLKTYDSGVVEQGSAKWVGLAINTGTNDITGVKYNGSALTSDDVAEAACYDLGAGYCVLWIKADVVVSTPKTFTLGAAGKNTVTYTVSFVAAE